MKDPIPIFLLFGIDYEFKCSGCNATYCCKHKWHCKFGIRENLEIPAALTGKRPKGDKEFARKEHHIFCNHLFYFDNFSVIASNNNEFKTTLMESLLINRYHPPPLSKNRH